MAGNPILNAIIGGASASDLRRLLIRPGPMRTNPMMPMSIDQGEEGLGMLMQAQPMAPRVTPKAPMAPEAAQPVMQDTPPSANAPQQMEPGPAVVSQNVPMPRARPAEAGVNRPITAFEDRIAAVQEAFQPGTAANGAAAFDPQGALSTSHFGGSNVMGRGSSPVYRFLDAAMRTIGSDRPISDIDTQGMAAQHVNTTSGVKINSDNFNKMLKETPPSQNIEDRRDEQTWMNKPWRTMEKADYAELDKAARGEAGPDAMQLALERLQTLETEYNLQEKIGKSIKRLMGEDGNGEDTVQK